MEPLWLYPLPMVVSEPIAILAGLFALVAAGAWWRVARSVDTSGETVTGPDKREIKGAALVSAGVLVLAGVSVLLPALLSVRL